MRKFELRDLQNEALATIIQNDEGLSVESAVDAEMEGFLAARIIQDNARTIDDLMAYGMSYVGVVEVTDDDEASEEM